MYSKWKQNLPLGFNILCSVNVCISSVAWTVKAECLSLARAVHIWKENFTTFFHAILYVDVLLLSIKYRRLEMKPTCKWSSSQMEDANTLIFTWLFSGAVHLILMFGNTNAFHQYIFEYAWNAMFVQN